MPGQGKNDMQCAEFEALLSEALDESLTGAKLESFGTHAKTCPLCGPLFADATEGRRWLKSLTEVEPPANLVHNILAATSGVESARSLAKPEISWKEAVVGWLRPVFTPVFAVARQPRFVMSFGMAFFSLSVALSMAGVKVKDLEHADLRPSAIKRTYYETSGRVVKYYENIRFVYEIESRVQQFKRATTPDEPRREQPNKERKNNNTSEQPEQRQERNYSQGESHIMVADLLNDRPVVTVTTYRRLV
jgi:hypothetical protein